MSLHSDSITIITRPEDINIDIQQGNVNISTIPEVITVQVGAVINTSSGTFVIGENPNGVINGSNAIFTTDNNFVPESVQLFVNGVSQTNGVDYFTTGTTTLNLNISPVINDILRVNYKLG
jgi:hypothetical protein